MKKSEIRKKIIKERDEIDREKKLLLDKLIEEKLVNTSIFKESKNIFIYLGFGSEIDTISFVKKFLKMGKVILVPVTDMGAKTMDAVKIDSLELLERNSYGIYEPKDSKEAFDKEEIDLIILPGVAFDEEGNRVGYGGGYYDRYLCSIRKDIPKIALAYDLQVISGIPAEEHDIKADYIITESKTINSLQSKNFGV